MYEGLAEASYAPDWVTGVSIGAINAALSAGNPPRRSGTPAGLDDARYAFANFGSLAASEGPEGMRVFDIGRRPGASAERVVRPT